MDTFALIILVVIASLVSSAKKKAQQQAKKTKEAVYPASAKKAERPTLDTSWEVPRMEDVVPSAPVMGAEGIDTCHDYMLPKQPAPVVRTLETRAVPAPVMGAEGIDTCHDYMLSDLPAAQKNPSAESGLSPEEARDLMRGIILSEIMARPQQRYAARRR